jgi:hypothetical protein
LSTAAATAAMVNRTSGGTPLATHPERAGTRRSSRCRVPVRRILRDGLGDVFADGAHAFTVPNPKIPQR